ncbi:MAG: D-glycero-beta-D-manno-heptose-1,7-bisphosphate 7-phosphatase [Legionellales bacterium]|nr:D-glycero-beta-D-manno-heptose-1,7-bisphosphate 7-phosphatase [Legionellales bacterium]
MKTLLYDLIILDRDGVINFDSPHYIKSCEEWIPIPGALETMAAWSKQGIKLAIATNQSALARQLIDLETLNAIHDQLKERLTRLGGHLSCIKYCPHHPEDGCQCRKPQPGLLNEIAKEMGIKKDRILFIGDKDSDAKAAISAQVKFKKVPLNQQLALSRIMVEDCI